ncbi:hypothetical protein HOA92_00050 [archaeon]|jgi:hypothetical protein|nr:hypothetical protein [archaeon]MBT6761411.1 hypothetical protein [archaeon]
MRITPLKAIRLKCLEDCMCGASNEVKACSSISCNLWKFRLNIHPFTKKNKDNPYLQESNFEGLQNKSAKEVIKIIENKK